MEFAHFYFLLLKKYALIKVLGVEIVEIPTKLGFCSPLLVALWLYSYGVLGDQSIN